MDAEKKLCRVGRGAGEPARGLVEGDLVRAGLLLEAFGFVDGLALRERSVPRVSRSAITSPVAAPMRVRPGCVRRSSAAARTARCASSSWSSGTPKTAITTSPGWLSTLAP